MSFLSSLIIHQYVGAEQPPPPPQQCEWGTAQGTVMSTAQGTIFVFNCLQTHEVEEDG
jgi:hypothetical protein